MNFSQKLESIQAQNQSLLCVGLDSDYEKIPSFLQKSKNTLFEFNRQIIDATYDLVCAYKPNTAFYESLGENGIKQLKMTCDYLHENYKNIPIIIDAKRADIGNTNQGYVDFIFKYLQADAITVNPYLGQEALQPFLDKKDKGIIVLCKTSNPGSGEFQDLEINGVKLYQFVAKQVIQKWNKNKNCVLVIGATYPEQIAEIRKLDDEIVFLIPGIGTQGGEIEQTVQNAKNSQGKGMIINASRSIIFAGSEQDFAQKARNEALKLKTEINKYLSS
ncbi:orotidine-5'-phosphate decarboxylase [Candidatus Beckwithbacteria bacterium]|nr:orotidine-5'-phosphate decarboxylase [Candidatus Beckwithbacteria bacterium]